MAVTSIPDSDCDFLHAQQNSDPCEDTGTDLLLTPLPLGARPKPARCSLRAPRAPGLGWQGVAAASLPAAASTSSLLVA